MMSESPSERDWSIDKDAVMREWPFRSAIPKNYRDILPATMNPTLQLMHPKTSVYLHGPVGCGKTHQAWLWWLRWNSSSENTTPWKASPFYQSAELFDKIRASYDGEAFSVDTDRLVVIDDIGTERPTEWVIEKLGEIIDARYRECLPTFYTSNLTIKQLGDRVGDRIASRIMGMSEVMKLDGSDRRSNDSDNVHKH